MAEIREAKITVLSPVHIGSGRGDLIADYDFVDDGETIWVIDQERMFERTSEDAWNGRDMDVRISHILPREQYETCSHYSMKHPGGSVNRIVEHIMDASCHPYIPGSSLKGAIRTAIAWSMVKHQVVKIDKRDMGYNPRSAGSSIEARLFGSDPNRDMMRVLQVSDTQGGRDGDALTLSNVTLYSIRETTGSRSLLPKAPGFALNVETMPVGSELGFSIKLDSHLLQDNISRGLGFDQRKKWLIDFPKHCNDFAKEIVKLELDFYNSYPLPRVKTFYEELRQRFTVLDPERQFLLQIAWGTGWSSKTIGEALEASILNEAIERFRLGKPRYSIFPKTRRLVQESDVAQMPLGWIQVDLQ